MMSRVQKGLVPGLVATIVVSFLEFANMMLGPRAASFPRLLSVMPQMPDAIAVGWTAHLFVGTLVLGPAFGVLFPRLPTDTPESRGIVFAIGAFILMGLTVVLAFGALGGRPVGLFFMQAGLGTLAWMIATHAVYGIVLGNVYGRLVQRGKRVRGMPDAAAAH